jgi:hypothetical protein
MSGERICFSKKQIETIQYAKLYTAEMGGLSESDDSVLM